MVRVKSLLSLTKLYTFLLLMIPSVIVVSWLNVYLGNAQYTAWNYLSTFLLPAIGLAYGISLLTADRLHEGYILTYKRVLFTLGGLIGSLFLFSFVLTFFGFQSHFLTAYIPSVSDYDKLQVLAPNSNQPDPRETASKFYSFQLMIVFILMITFFTIASFLFKTKQNQSTVEVPLQSGRSRRKVKKRRKKTSKK